MNWATRIRSLALLACLGAAAFLLVAQRNEDPSGIEAIRQRGELVVAVRPGPASYYMNSFGPAGFEYDLARGFADEIGVPLKIVSVDSPEEGLDLVRAGKVDFAVGEARTPARQKQFAFSVPVQSVSQIVACAADRGGRLPATVTALADRHLVVTAGSHQAELLANLQATRVPSLQWQSLSGTSEENLLAEVHAGHADCTVVDANEWEFHRHLYPSIRVAQELPDSVYTGWVFRQERSSRLRDRANAWLASRLSDGTVASLQDRYFAQLKTLTQVDGKRFYDAIRFRLPRYVDLFRKEAERNNLDWRLLAAVAYQESLWDPAAQSPTGVQGIMQLTLDTALHLGIDDRTDPVASIRGGARYLRQILDQLPESIPEEDRTWMALAAYNAGVAHVLDARELARKRGGNPDSWPDVRDSLALLKQQQWYSQTRFGYARGATQALIYVRHVSRYYDLLVLASNRFSKQGTMVAMAGTGSRAVAN